MKRDFNIYFLAIIIVKLINLMKFNPTTPKSAVSRSDSITSCDDAQDDNDDEFKESMNL
jgi:hypothetical protein